jgi:hypothetical protein
MVEAVGIHPVRHGARQTAVMAQAGVIAAESAFDVYFSLASPTYYVVDTSRGQQDKKPVKEIRGYR